MPQPARKPDLDSQSLPPLSFGEDEGAPANDALPLDERTEISGAPKDMALSATMPANDIVPILVARAAEAAKALQAAHAAQASVPPLTFASEPPPAAPEVFVMTPDPSFASVRPPPSPDGSPAVVAKPAEPPATPWKERFVDAVDRAAERLPEAPAWMAITPPVWAVYAVMVASLWIEFGVFFRSIRAFFALIAKL